MNKKNEDENRNVLIFTTSGDEELKENIEKNIDILKFLKISALLAFSHSNEINDFEYSAGYDIILNRTIEEIENLILKKGENNE